jgi:SAM-dependent methyltransferase
VSTQLVKTKPAGERDGRAVSLSCPVCRVSPLQLFAGQAECPECGGRWPRLSGVVCFQPDVPYWGEIPRPAMERCLEVAAEDGWQTALDTVVAEANPSYRRSLADAASADCWTLVGLAPGSVVLDGGSGWGRLAFRLPPWCQVFSLEAVPLRAQFQEIRRRQSRRSNITVVQGLLTDSLPLPPGSVDVVWLNGVFEWLGLEGAPASPAAIQMAALRRVQELLKPGGRLFIAIENRLGLRYFVGVKDHSGLPFTSLLPRPAADAAVRAYRRFSPAYRSETTATGYRTYTYSIPGYRRLLGRAGFDCVDVHALLPSYSLPLLAFDVDRTPGWLLRRALRLLHPPDLKTRLALSAVGLLSHTPVLSQVWPDVGLVAHKGPAAQATNGADLDGLAARAWQARAGGPRPVAPDQYGWVKAALNTLEEGRLKLFVFDLPTRRLHSVATLPRRPEGAAGQFPQLAVTVRRHLPERWRPSIPGIYGNVPFGGTEAVLEEGVDCPSLLSIWRRCRPARRRRQLPAVITWAEEWCWEAAQAAWAAGCPQAASAEARRAEVEAIWEQVGPHLRDLPGRAAIPRLIAPVVSASPAVMEQGDFVPRNLLPRGDGYCIVDWENSRADGYVGHDLTRLALSSWLDRAYHRRRPPSLAAPPWEFPVLGAALSRHVGRFGLPHRSAGLLMLWAILRTMSLELSNGHARAAHLLAGLLACLSRPEGPVCLTP